MSQYNPMDARKGVGSASQRSTQFPPSSTGANVRPPEASVLGVATPVLNYSIQTGEEFALEFMRERAISKKPMIQTATGDQNMATGYTDMTGILIPHMGSESASDVLAPATGDSWQFKEVEKQNFSETDRKVHYESSWSMPRASSGEGSSRTTLHGYSLSEYPDVLSKRMKFLCSFGGKIIPRPSDGKLRYVGGDTRIIRISRDISWDELMQKTIAIYNRPHTVKYQLPGEDLDALISVSCDEDLQNMMEEYTVLEGADGSHKLRMFLFSSDDTDDVHYSLGSMEGDSEIQYVAAVNGIDLGSGKSSHGHGLTSTSISDLDQLLNLNVEAERANPYMVATQSVGYVTAPVASATTFTPTLQESSSTAYDSHSQSFEGQRYQFVESEHYAYNPINPPDRYQNADSRDSIVLPMPSDYQYQSNYTDIPGQQSFYQSMLQDPYNGVSPFDRETVKKNEKLAVDSFSQKKVEREHINSHNNEPAKTIDQHDASASSSMHAEIPYAAVAPDAVTSVQPPKNKGKQLEPAPVFSSTNTVNAGHGSEMNEDDQYSSGALMSGFSDYETDVINVNYGNPPSRPFRVYQSERLPREQAGFLNRLSKSDDSINSHYLINEACPTGAQESIAEAVDTLVEGESGAKPPCSNNATLEKYKKLENTINQDYKFEPVSVLQVSETVSSSPQPMSALINQDMQDPNGASISSVVQAGSDHTDASDERNYKQGRKIQMPESQHAPPKSAYNKPTVVEDRILPESNMSRHMEKATNVGEIDVTKINIREPHNVGAFINAQEGPSVLADIPWEDISNKDIYNGNVQHAPAFSWVESTVGAVSREETSAPTPERILIDINDRFPPNLLSDIFYKAGIADNLSNINLLRKDDAGVSVNMQNHEPKRWSFFRNLAQDEFGRKDFSLMDQDHISYSSVLPKVEEGVCSPYQFAPLENERVDFGHIDSQIDFSEEMQESSNTIADNTNILHEVYIPSQIPHPLGIEKGEGLQVENPYAKLGETLKTHISENDESKFEGGEAAEPVLDASVDDFDLSNLQIIENEDLEELRELGSGTFGTVYHGKWRGTDVAIKRIKKSCFTGRSSEKERLTIEFWREAEILSQLHHPNVVAFYGVVKDGPGGTLATVTEFMVNGSLRHVLLRKDKYLDRRKRLIIAMDAAFGMEYLHSKNIVHFDLKCDNLLVNLKDQSRPICKVGDFGLSKIKRNTLVSGGVRGTLPWMAPELLNGSSNKVSEKVDVFSFGIVMWEILTGEEPYANMHYGAIIGGIVNNTLRPPVPATCDPEWRKLMELCWAPDPAQRPSFTQIAGRLRSMSVASQAKPAK
ncbi:unnamed protein product [Musa acuminata var. zebrina]